MSIRIESFSFMKTHFKMSSAKFWPFCLGIGVINLPDCAWRCHQIETFSDYCPFVRGIYRSPLDSPTKGQRRGAFMFWYLPEQTVEQTSRRRWFETPSWSLWRHCNGQHCQKAYVRYTAHFRSRTFSSGSGEFCSCWYRYMYSHCKWLVD